MSVVNYGTSNPTIDTSYFPNTNVNYWSSTTVANDLSSVWYVFFYDGAVSHEIKTESNVYTRCVRGGQYPAQNFTDNSDGTVTDNNTGFMWQKEDDNTNRTWENAISYCEGLTLATQSDWRLPNIKELASITDYTTYNPSIETALFPNTDNSGYWSSTVNAGETSSAFAVAAFPGNIGDNGKLGGYLARCVRGGATSWADTFETYNAGVWPSENWVVDANGGYVDDTVAYEGSKSLKITGSIGGCWAGIGYRTLNVSPPFYVEAWVKNDTESLSGCHRNRADIGLRKGTSWTNPGRRFVLFHGNNKILGTTNATELGTYTPGNWYHIKIKYEKPTASTVMVTYWINNTYISSETVSAILDEDSLDNLQLGCGEGSCWFDEVKVYIE